MACLSLSGCIADYPLKAFVKDGKVYFDGAGWDWFLGRTGFCPKYFSVQSQSGETVWRIEPNHQIAECKLFPVAYGIAPEDWGSVVSAKPLKSGELYLLKGQGGDSYHGAFRYRERRAVSVENDAELSHKFPDPPYVWNDVTE